MKVSLVKCSLFFVTVVGLASCGNVKQSNVSAGRTNALMQETSPYLLQHANNPVNWQPWSNKILEEARSEGKLLLVSIGYSSCHWCHVMEAETFEDQEVADFMNEHFISIKVDREERPDIDKVYMTALQLIKGSGGWPLNVITLPNGNPLYGGTYHTREQWMQVLQDVNSFYTEDPEKARNYGEMLAMGIQETNIIVPPTDEDPINAGSLEESVSKWKSSWDLDWGGDKGDEKFMMPTNLNFLLNYSVLANNRDLEVHVKNSLQKILQGGIHDQIGGGFYRYSTDTYWKVPHFEKMLYDNALMLSVYSTAFKAFKENQYREVVLGITDFLEREMKHPGGGYYAALDADSEGIEGKYYLWEEGDLRAILAEEYELFSLYYSLPAQELTGARAFILFRDKPDRLFAADRGISMADFQSLKAKWHSTLLKAREKRIPPGKDDKIITSWNALLMLGFLDAYAALGNEEYLDKSLEILDFLQNNSLRDGKLIHSFKEGGNHVPGFLEDYAFLLEAVLKLYGFTMNPEHLDLAIFLNSFILEEFSDEETGMFRFNQTEELISKLILTHDGVIPSPNASMALSLFQLGHLTGNKDFLERSKKMLASMIPNIRSDGRAYAKWNELLMHLTHPYMEVAVVGSNSKNLIKRLNQTHLPNTLIVGTAQESELPLFNNRLVSGKTLVYVCKNNTCKLPVALPEQAIDIIYTSYEEK
ncbi:thioredoxin domain-containing protein [Cyclobacterium roseum]|uniref:thioredoxin domain-containing protein n=1 Tax=Cyclobacterium roseum TaxID=2666137 RepID=UPI001391363E|nr:thioredoxin domain-containing protein [Cyclobacterium roseum]